MGSIYDRRFRFLILGVVYLVRASSENRLSDVGGAPEIFNL